MALTNYLTHSVVALIIFVFLGYWGALERHQLYYIVFAIWAVQLVISPIWLRHFHFGPVEWLWRYLTYGKAPPFRKARPIRQPSRCPPSRHCVPPLARNDAGEEGDDEDSAIAQLCAATDGSRARRGLAEIASAIDGAPVAMTG